MVYFEHRGNFKKTEKFLNSLQKRDFLRNLDKYGLEGVIALSEATPKDTAETAHAWDYEIVNEKGKAGLYWTNSNIEDGVPIVILIQYGHATKNGGYIEGRDFINPAIQPIFDKIADNIWKEVRRL